MRKHRKLLPPIGGTLACLLLVFFVACQPAKTTDSTANAHANATPNANASSPSSSSSDNTKASSENAGAPTNTREPDKYAATLVFSIETQGGEKAIGIPSLSIQVARSGQDRRVEFKLPDGTPLIYLDH